MIVKITKDDELRDKIFGVDEIKITGDNITIDVAHNKIIADINANIFVDDIPVSDYVHDETFESGKTLLKNLKPDDVFTIKDKKFVVLMQSKNGGFTKILDPKPYEDIYGPSNFWGHSKIRNYLNHDYRAKLHDYIGDSQLYEIDCDLTSWDNLKTYNKELGEVVDKVSLLTVTEYYKHRDIVRKHCDKPVCTVTPVSTFDGDGDQKVCVIEPNGTVHYNYCYMKCCAYPLMYVYPNIEVTKIKEEDDDDEKC